MSFQHVELSSSEILATPIKECGEQLVSVEGFLEFGPPPESPLTSPYYQLLREGVLTKLLKAQEHLPKGLKFRLYEGYRSLSFQASLFQEQYRRVKLTESHLSQRESYEKASLLVAPIKSFNGDSLFPPHSTGGAIDIEIIDSSGQPIDFGMEIKDWFRVPVEVCSTNYAGLSSRAKSNRAMLVSALANEGFVNYSREWWHFSYGDQYWAFIKGQTHALYGLVQH